MLYPTVQMSILVRFRVCQQFRYVIQIVFSRGYNRKKYYRRYDREIRREVDRFLNEVFCARAVTSLLRTQIYCRLFTKLVEGLGVVDHHLRDYIIELAHLLFFSLLISILLS